MVGVDDTALFHDIAGTALGGNRQVTYTIKKFDWLDGWSAADAIMSECSEWRSHKQRPNRDQWEARGRPFRLPFIVIAYDDETDKPIGYQAGYIWDGPPRYGYLWSAAVLPGYRRRGVMTALLKYFGAEARESWSVLEIRTHTGTDFPDMLNLLPKRGFKTGSGSNSSAHNMEFYIPLSNL